MGTLETNRPQNRPFTTVQIIHLFKETITKTSTSIKWINRKL